MALLVPSSASILAKKAPGNRIGTISLKYSIPAPASNQDYDEDEQLYAAMAVSRDKYAPVSIPVMGRPDQWVAVVVPALENAIAYNVLATALVEYVPAATWVTVAPCSIYGHTVAKLETGPHQYAAAVPNLCPPHFVTGIAAAVNKRAKDALCLVVSAEGQTGYERVDADALADVSRVLGDCMHFGAEYHTTVAKAVRKTELHSIYV